MKHSVYIQLITYNIIGISPHTMKLSSINMKFYSCFNYVH